MKLKNHIPPTLLILLALPPALSGAGPGIFGVPPPPPPVYVPVPTNSTGRLYSTLDQVHPLEDAGRSARAAAMGSSFAAVEGDAACLYWNPAGLASLPHPQLSALHHSALEGTRQETLLFALPLRQGRSGALGIGFNLLDYGTLEGYDANGAPTDPYHPSRLSLTLGWGAKFLKNLSLGLAAREASQSIGESRNMGFSLQGGILWKAFRDLKAGGSYSFWVTQEGEFAAAGMLRLGLAYPFLKAPGRSTLLTAGLALPPYGTNRIQAGLEQELASRFFLRAGYQHDLADNALEGLQGLTAGLGLRFEMLDLDYAFLPMGDFGATHQLGLGYRFGPKEEGGSPLKAPPSQALQFRPAEGAQAGDVFVDKEVQFKLQPPGGQAPGALTPELEKALKAWEEEVRRHPQDPKAWINLGNLYWKAGQADYAVQSFEEALRLDPSNGALKNWLSQHRKKKP